MSVPVLGPFRLTARTFSSPAGIVYSGLDPVGSPLEVVVLTRGAASDPAARDRFAAAVRDFDGLVVARDTDSAEPWAAGGPGLARTLEPVLLHGRARGPQFLPYWAGAEDPAFPSGRLGPLVAPKGERPRGIIPALMTLLLMAILLGVLLGLLFACQPDPLNDDESRLAPRESITATGGETGTETTPPTGESPDGGAPDTASPSTSPSSGGSTRGTPSPTDDGESPTASGGSEGTPDGDNGQGGDDGGDPF